MSSKKKLHEMTTDEFLAHGFDSDVSSGEEQFEEEPVIKEKETKKSKAKVKKIVKSESSKHKKQLKALEDKDPEFYKFLKENDDELLAFSGSEDDSNEGDADNEVDDKDLLTNDVSSEDEDDSDSDADGDNIENTSQDENDDVTEQESTISEDVKSKVVTQSMIKDWKASLEKGSVKTLKLVMHALHSAVETLSPDEKKDDANEEDSKYKQAKKKFVVEGGTLFNSLVTMCLKYSLKILEAHLDYATTKKNKKKQLPSSSKQWSNIKATVKQYLLDILQIMRQVAEPVVILIILKHAQALLPYYASFPKISKMLLKRLIRMWCTADEHIRVSAFLGIRKLAILVPSLFEFALKHLYMAFVRNSKFVTLKTKPVIQFMRNSLVEMYALDQHLTYQQAFVFIRQLAINLRKALTSKKKEAYQAVYNWQFISCLQLWCQVICDLYGDVLKPLVYPLVQITLGVISLIPSTRYYPIRFLCISLLNNISEKTGVYIPTATYILEALELPEFQKRPSSSEKPPDFNATLKLTKAQLTTKGFQDATIDLAFESFLQHYTIYSYSIAFPELIFPICHRIKRLIKSSRIIKLNKDMKLLLDKLQSYADELTKDRDLVTFAPKDIELVRQWEAERQSKKNSLKEFMKTWNSMKTIAKDIHDKEEEEEKEESQYISQDDVKKKTKKRKKTDDKTDDKEIVKKKPKKKAVVKEQVNNEEDILEDFKFSDEDE